MVRHALPVLLSCVLFSGCASRGGRIAAGAGTMVVGAMFMADPGNTAHNTSPDSDNPDRGSQVIGSAMLITGAILIVAGLATQDQPAEQPAARPAIQPAAYTQPYGYAPYGYAQPTYAQPYAQPVSYPPPPAYAPPYSAPAAQPTYVAAPAAEAPRPAQAAIVGRVENRLALQASAAAHAGQCASAVITANKLAVIDPELHVSLLERDTELALCYASSN